MSNCAEAETAISCIEDSEEVVAQCVRAGFLESDEAGKLIRSMRKCAGVWHGTKEEWTKNFQAAGKRRSSLSLERKIRIIEKLKRCLLAFERMYPGSPGHVPAHFTIAYKNSGIGELKERLEKLGNTAPFYREVNLSSHEHV